MIAIEPPIAYLIQERGQEFGVGCFVGDVEEAEFSHGFLAPAKGDGGGRQGPDFRFFLHTAVGGGGVVAGLPVFLNEVIAQKLKSGLPVLYKGRKFENDAGDKVGIGLGLDGNSRFHTANHKDGLDQTFLERSAHEFRTLGFAEAGKCGFGLGDGHTPFDVPEAIRIALAIEVLRLAGEQAQRGRREEKSRITSACPNCSSAGERRGRSERVRYVVAPQSRNHGVHLVLDAEGRRPWQRLSSGPCPRDPFAENAHHLLPVRPQGTGGGNLEPLDRNRGNCAARAVKGEE
jgi:hypothetical protein